MPGVGVTVPLPPLAVLPTEPPCRWGTAAVPPLSHSLSFLRAEAPPPPRFFPPPLSSARLSQLLAAPVDFRLRAAVATDAAVEANGAKGGEPTSRSSVSIWGLRTLDCLNCSFS